MHIRARAQSHQRHDFMSGRTNAIKLNWIRSAIESLEARRGPSCSATHAFTPPSMSAEQAVASLSEQAANMELTLPPQPALVSLAASCINDGESALSEMTYGNFLLESFSLRSTSSPSI